MTTIRHLPSKEQIEKDFDKALSDSIAALKQGPVYPYTVMFLPPNNKIATIDNIKIEYCPENDKISTIILQYNNNYASLEKFLLSVRNLSKINQSDAEDSLLKADGHLDKYWKFTDGSSVSISYSFSKHNDLETRVMLEFYRGLSEVSICHTNYSVQKSKEISSSDK